MSEVIEKVMTNWLVPYKWAWLVLILPAMSWATWPDRFSETVIFVLNSFLAVAPLVIPGILVSAWVSASGAGGRIKSIFAGHGMKTIFMASAIGAVSPVCGVTVLPLMAGLLASGVPLAPVMAFWLSSPVTDPAMLMLTVATLGLHFAVGKTLAAFALGLFGGLVTGAINQPWKASPLRKNSITGGLVNFTCGSDPTFNGVIWNSPERMQAFTRQMVATTRLMLICLGLAFSAEFLMQEFMQPEALAVYVGSESWWAIPVAVFVGAPAYLDGYAALPLTRGLINHGMSPGAAMAFLVSGGVVSIWGALAIFPVLKIKPFLLYLFLALTGSLMVGYLYGAVS